MHQQLTEATAHMEEWMKTEEETPQQEQERLLRQVKADNQEMGSIEKRYYLCYYIIMYLLRIEGQLPWKLHCMYIHEVYTATRQVVQAT